MNVGLQSAKPRGFHELTVILPDAEPPTYTVEWLENVPSHYHWPNIVERIEGTEKNFSFTDDRIIAVKPTNSSERAAMRPFSKWRARSSISGPRHWPQTARRPERAASSYEGAPDELTRKKFRTALSFAFGAYLVETGHTVFDKDWRVVCAAARSAYSLGGRAAELTVQPLMWLSDRNAEFDIGHASLTRMVERLFAHYDDLDLPNLSWAYWHSRTAPPRIAPAHSERQSRPCRTSYIKLHPASSPTKSFRPRIGVRSVRHHRGYREIVNFRRRQGRFQRRTSWRR